MKRLILILVALGACTLLHAQQQPSSDVFSSLSENLTVEQSPALEAAMNAHVQRNQRRAAQGVEGQTYSIRIYLDSGQQARSRSEAIAERFRRSNPGVPVTRSFTEPFFKVTVGNYSTRAEAAAALKLYQSEYPTAFIVRN